MIETLKFNLYQQDLTGSCYFHPHFWQIQNRINALVFRYFSVEKLSDRLADLPIQFANPQPRPWQHINWQNINCEQIIGINLDVFLSIIVGAIDTEAPIRGYTQTSRKYLENLHPQMARFVGGVVGDDSILELGLWEKEERQHTPALIKIYDQLTGKRIVPNFRPVRGYQPSDDPYQNLYKHGFHRVATEYGASCLYLWLMAHTTGTLQEVLAQLVQDEINHMAKFWGFGLWAFPHSSPIRIGRILLQTGDRNYERHSLSRTLHRMQEVLNWRSWSLTNKATFIFTIGYTMHRLWCWSNSLTPEYLQQLFGNSEFFTKSV